MNRWFGAVAPASYNIGGVYATPCGHFEVLSWAFIMHVRMGNIIHTL